MIHFSKEHRLFLQESGMLHAISMLDFVFEESFFKQGMQSYARKTAYFERSVLLFKQEMNQSQGIP